MRRTTRRTETIETAALAVVLACAVAVPLPAGNLTGVVRGPGGVPLAGAVVVAAAATCSGGDLDFTDANGVYTLTGLGPECFVLAYLPGSRPELIAELYADIPCPEGNGCTMGLAGTEVLVPATGTAAGPDFDLTIGGSIAGTVFGDADPDQPLDVGGIDAFDLRGRQVAFAVPSSADGSYLLQGLPSGRYLVRTRPGGPTAANFVGEVYPNVPCPNAQCDPLSGVPVTVSIAGVTGVDFLLAPAGTIAGIVAAESVGAIASAEVQAYRAGVLMGSSLTASDGSYQIRFLPPAADYRILARKAGFVTELWSQNPPSNAVDAFCPGGACDESSAGGAILVTVGGTATADLLLDSELTIQGKVKRLGIDENEALVTAQWTDGNGLAGTSSTDNNGDYTIRGLPPGSEYYLGVSAPRSLAEVYPDTPCPITCTTGTPVAAGGTANFDLAAGDGIRGRITDAATGDPLGLIPIEVIHRTGSGLFAIERVVSRGKTEVDGLFFRLNRGLPPGNYYVRTAQQGPLPLYLDEIWNNRPCEPSCSALSGTPITLAGGADVTGIDFGLISSGLSFYTLPPCRVYDSRASGGPALSVNTVGVLQVESRCGVPGHAAAVSANVTVLGASGAGNLKIWGANLPEFPNSTVLSFCAGQTRANNAVVSLALTGLVNIGFQANVLAGGTFHLVLDVNGYWAPAVSP